MIACSSCLRSGKAIRLFLTVSINSSGPLSFDLTGSTCDSWLKYCGLMNWETLLTSPVLKASITCLASLVLPSSVASAPCPDA